MLSSSNPASQLMQLGQSEPVCIFHHHHRGIGHIDAHFDYSCRYQHINASGTKLLHDPILISGTHFPMKIGHCNRLRKHCTKLVRIIHHILQLIQFSFLYLGADHIDLPALSHLSG